MDHASLILIVEDEYLIAQYLADVLAELGYRHIQLERDLESGLSFVAAVTPSLAILDVNVGKHLVFPLADELAKRGVPIIFSTALQRNMLPEKWRTHHMVPKPVQVGLLSRTLNAILHTRVSRDRVSTKLARD